MCIMALNPEKNGIELSFNSKPVEEIRTKMKDLGFRWHRQKKIWYARQTESRLALARELSGENSPAIKQEPEAKVVPFPKAKSGTETISKYGIKPGNILTDTWGYSMTLVEFYKVISIPSPSKVEIVELGLTIVPDSQDSGGGEKVLPDLEREMGDRIVKQVVPRKGTDSWYIKINDSVKLHPWDGQPKYRNTYD